MRLNRRYKILIIFVLNIILTSISGCSGFKYLTASFKSTSDFNKSDTNPDVRFRGNNKQYANHVGIFTPKIIAIVEDKIGVKFLKMPIIFICDTWSCIKEFTGHNYKPRASTNKRGIFISPKLIGDLQTTEFLMPHEVTHALWADKVNSMFHPIPPAWFTEGIATFIANGAGAEKVPREKAKESIIKGKYFIPNSDGKIMSAKYGGAWGLEQPMFYRQSMLMIEYMRTISHDNFNNLVKDVFSKQVKFSDLFYKYYSTTPSALWLEYVAKVRGA